MKNSDVRYDFIYEIVTNFIIEENITFPILNIFEICKRLGISVLSDVDVKNKFQLDYCKIINSQDGASVYMKNSEKYIILYNSKVCPFNRIKYTIGHELGHIVLGHFDCQSLSEETKERESDYFSMLLLMHPLFILRKFLISCEEVEFSCQTTNLASKAGFNNYRNFCRYHKFIASDLKLLSLIDKNLMHQRLSKTQEYLFR